MEVEIAEPVVWTVNHLLDTFLAWVGRHRAGTTVRFYKQRLKLFRARFGNRLFASLTSLEVDEYLHDAGKKDDGEDWSGSTRHHNAVAVQTLHRFALREKLIEKPLFGVLEKPRVGQRERVPTQEEIEKLLAECRPDFHLLYRGLMQCGARPGELCRLKIEEHLDWDKRLIVLFEHKTARKTGKPRLIPIGAKLEAILREAMGDRTAGPVFLTARGKQWEPAHASACHRKARNKAGLDKEIVLYLARHRFGTRLIESGEDIKTVADLMGHKRVTTTERYVHRDVAQLGVKQDLI